MPEYSVIIPAFREAQTIERALAGLRRELDATGLTYEVLLVSDGNTDGTEKVAEAIDFPQMSVLHYEPNRGKGYALRYGTDRARAPLIGFMDADLDISPTCVRTLLDQLISTDADAVVGSKVHPQSQLAYPWFRRFQSRVFRALVRSLFSLDIADTQTGCKVFRREVLDNCLDLVQTEGFTFDLELLVLANDSGYRITEGPIRLEYQFSSTTGLRAVVTMLREVGALVPRRRRGQKSGTWPQHNTR